ncbi:MAG: glycosyltransferase family 4 protein, partial [Desulfobacterales bacterium]|nr:glycosyltransferase family 4 protein [Desulfobacterales bacterium]
MKILLLTPSHESKARGNTVTVDRWKNGLTRHGVEVKKIGPESLEKMLQTWRPDLIHAHHSAISGVPALTWSRKLGIPLVISISGTDLNGTADAGPDPAGLEALGKARAIISPFPDNQARLSRKIGLLPPFHVIRRGIRPKAVQKKEKPGRTLEILQVGGIRPVKGQLRALELMARLRKKALPARLTLIGPVVDGSYAREVFALLKKQPQDRHLAAIPHKDMDRIYAIGDVLLNCSENEGAANAILEAWSCGVPVAARKAPGNNQLLGKAPVKIAMLFHEQSDFNPLL